MAQVGDSTQYLAKRRNTKITSFHSNAVLLHCRTSPVARLGLIYSVLLLATHTHAAA